MQALDNSIDFNLIEVSDSMAQPFSRECTNLADFNPRGFGEEVLRKSVGQGKAGALRLARDGERNHRAGVAVKHLMAEHQHWTPTGLFTTFRRLQVGPIDVAP